MSRDSVLTRTEIKDRISKGEVLVIYNSLVLRLDKWIKYHPGGDKVIYHLVGKDATTEMNILHGDDTIDTFAKWRIGRIDYRWENLLPPIQAGKTQDSKNTKLDIDEDDEESEATLYSSSSSQSCDSTLNSQATLYDTVIADPMLPSERFDAKLIEDEEAELPSFDPDTQAYILEEYEKTRKLLLEAGLFNCRYYKYLKEAARIGTLLFLVYYTLYHKNMQLLSAFLLGCAWQQAVFIAHDAGHISITHHYQVDSVIGIIIASFIGGLSLGWWKRSHNVHHLVTNDPEHDPDIQQLPFFASSVRFFKNLYSTYYERYVTFDILAKKLVPLQHYYYYPILAFGRFNLYVLSWTHLLSFLGPCNGSAAWFRYLEIAGMLFFNYWFVYLILICGLNTFWERVQYVLVSHCVTVILHVQILLSHFAMSSATVSPKESFPLRQVRSSMDVHCPPWLDFFHGGLQFQIVHHLFPRLPRHNLREAQPHVIELCKKVGIKYTIYGFYSGNKKVVSHLRDIAQQAKIMLDCANTLQKEGLYEH
ncbi:HER075Cp [Eremothecium sinecaudum]|uniref:Delta 8-(E)-sphingolipid desaturase n=1 Tax=Eremothecium sinecaudum TaxID=45286 RepID=A0A0X8HTV4_9SACH|nr:HER075Cp [Eremothecium sinecaudum]AMD21354.1 HER075Cp [Eremothecium sinecaudum]